MTTAISRGTCRAVSANDSAVLIKQAEAKATAAKTQMRAQAPSSAQALAAAPPAPGADDAKDVVHVTYVPPAVRAQIAHPKSDGQVAMMSSMGAQ